MVTCLLVVSRSSVRRILNLSCLVSPCWFNSSLLFLTASLSFAAVTFSALARSELMGTAYRYVPPPSVCLPCIPLLSHVCIMSSHDTVVYVLSCRAWSSSSYRLKYPSP